MNNEREKPTPVMNIKEILKQKGYKDSKIKNEVIKIIFESKSQLDAQEILQKLKKNRKSANKTSVYRILKILRQENLINETVLLDRKKRYSPSYNIRHPHFICRICNKDICVDESFNQKDFFKSIELKYHLDIYDFDFQMFGVCQECNTQ
jgi:Fur family transcriptional regulator, ferric uptake regulator